MEEVDKLNALIKKGKAVLGSIENLDNNKVETYKFNILAELFIEVKELITKLIIKENDKCWWLDSDTNEKVLLAADLGIVIYLLSQSLNIPLKEVRHNSYELLSEIKDIEKE